MRPPVKTTSSLLRFIDQTMKYLLPSSIVFVSVIVSGFFLYLASTRSLTNLENILFQIFALGTGLTGSFIFGRLSASAHAREVIRPHARSAFRRLMSLYNGLSRVLSVIEESEEESVKLKVINAIVVEQVSTAGDALEDWRDMDPESVEEVSTKIRRPSGELEGLRNG